ncbi:hypothetical protein SGFS_009280 [Streptomyces graminofaciens]|uniref:Uncharacterized protein n=1 Tax=Streptomyces graminofaciens TaxID=68212 RepID=A0ABN5V9H2_9ACTN|nr:hypothetical protein SGFS_009280 [Streptomyces graminofaciens]
MTYITSVLVGRKERTTCLVVSGPAEAEQDARDNRRCHGPNPRLPSSACPHPQWSALGGYAVQLAAHRGVKVTALAGAADEEFVHELGAAPFPRTPKRGGRARRRPGRRRPRGTGA